MTLLDVQHIKKIYKTRFQGTQVEALKDIHFTVEKQNTAQPAANKATYQAPAQVRPTEVASKQGTLPKTGSKNPFLLSMFGLVFGMLGAAGLKKTQKD